MRRTLKTVALSVLLLALSSCETTTQKYVATLDAIEPVYGESGALYRYDAYLSNSAVRQLGIDKLESVRLAHSLKEGERYEWVEVCSFGCYVVPNGGPISE